uniref:NUBP iron-sulfur cluster assembly factor 2, cytosolic n=1 Tax=Salvator merianae TaxID=96440 RepID=A0A8D0DL09_SALMN
MEEKAADDRGNLAGVQRIVLVLSGKGGVGKSTFSAGLALALCHAGKKVGILDVDLCGPSIPRMLSAQDQDVHQCDRGWVPVFVGQDKSIALMSIAFLLEKPDDAVIWRGPKKNALIKQFVSEVTWGELDFLIVDTPPGTSDEHISVVEALRPYKPLGAILVTTPQAVSVGDVRRELTFCRKTGLPVLGIVENMSSFVCPHCSECTSIFSTGGGQELAKHAGVPFLGCMPVDPQLSQTLEEGKGLLQDFTTSVTFPILANIAQRIMWDVIFSCPHTPDQS